MLLLNFLRHPKTIPSRACPRANNFILTTHYISDSVVLYDKLIKYMNPKFGAIIPHFDLMRDLQHLIIPNNSSLSEISATYSKLQRRFILTHQYPPIRLVVQKYLQQLA